MLGHFRFVAVATPFRFVESTGTERLFPTGPNPLYHRDDEVDRPRAMGV